MSTSARIAAMSVAVASILLVSAARTAARSDFDEFKIAAGTSITIQIKTALSSDSNHNGDQIDGSLVLPLASGETELVPSGAPVFGSVGNVRVPERETGPGRLELRFTIIEHPETHSRVRITATPVSVEGERVKTRKRGVPATKLTDAQVASGTIVSVTLLEPFVVKIPRAR
jgi:hypothetical protein